MKQLHLFSLAFFSLNSAFAQLQPLTTPNQGGNKQASVSEYIGLCEVAISYHRPGVKGREGKIWGTPVAHYGLQDLQFGSSKAAPWRAGANTCTVIAFSTDAKVEGKPIPAGRYGLFVNLGETESTLIFNKNTTAWGSFSYNPAEDVLQVSVKNEALPQSVEWMKFEFEGQTDSSAVVALSWEKRKIPFRVQVDLRKTQFALFKKELETPKGFSVQAFVQAAGFCLQNNYELEQGFAWAERAASSVFPGERNFLTLSTKAAFLNKQGKTAEADALMKEAFPMGTMQQVHQYARNLLTQKRNKEAFDVFKMNYDRFPNQFTTNNGMGRAYSALGDYKKALEYMKLALAQAPNPLNKNNVEGLIKKLEQGQDVN